MWLKVRDWGLSDWDPLWKLGLGICTGGGCVLHLHPSFFFFLLQTNNKNGYVSDLNFRLALLPVLSANWPSGHSGFRGQRPQQPPKTPMTVCFSARPTVSIQSHSPPPEGRTATPEISWQQNPTWFPSPASAARVSLAGTEGGTGITTQKSHIPSLNISLCFVF